MFGIRRKNSDAARSERLDALGVAISKKRDEAVQARKESGIEDIWQACEDAYLGIDDSNRHEFAKAKWAKSRSIDGPISTNDTVSDSTRSTVFVRLTSRYVDFAASKMSEIALPIDDKAFSFEPTPVPDLVAGMEDETPLKDQMGSPVTMPGPDGQPVQKTVKDAVAEVIEQAKDSAKKAEKRIYDWMVECRHSSEMRKTIFDSARLGVGVLKGPIPDKRRSQAISRKGNIIELILQEKTVPATRWVDPWNLFPDPACGENIQDGDYIFERDYASSKRLREFAKRKGWNKAKVEQVLKEGPGKCYQDGNPTEEKDKRKRFELWQYYGQIDREDLEAAGVNAPNEGETFYAIITLVNDSVVRCILNPMDSGKFPYHAFAWSRRAGHWAGVGVGEQVSMPQRMVNAATRATLENAGISAGVQIIMDRGLITPSDQQWSITRNKIWFKKADAVLDDVRKAFNIIEIPNLTAQLMPIIQYALRLAEEHSSIPLVSQGQYAEGGSPQTYGQAELQNTNALSFLRERGNLLDDAITEPLVLMFYEWLLLDPDVPMEEKGDFEINAHGTSALVEKAIQEVTITQALSLSLNPAFGADPEKVYELWIKSKRIDPRDVKLDEEKKAAMQQQPQAKAPQVEAAEIRANAELQKEQMRTNASVEKMRMDMDRDTAYVQELRDRAQTVAAGRAEELAIKRELALLEYANRHQITLETLKTQLARDAMKLRTTKELAAMSAPAKALPTPPVEPPGQARPGHSYTE
ncbi:MAG TPA: hypothetical protein VK149_12285 [Sideroxyarcus sp.]|nr:hypothetical protein [Sideroxyarcus sp.]